MTRKILASVLQAAGLAAVATGVALICLWGGVIVAGAGAVLLGVAIERSS